MDAKIGARIEHEREHQLELDLDLDLGTLNMDFGLAIEANIERLTRLLACLLGSDLQERHSHMEISAIRKYVMQHICRRSGGKRRNGNREIRRLHSGSEGGDAFHWES